MLEMGIEEPERMRRSNLKSNWFKILLVVYFILSLFIFWRWTAFRRTLTTLEVVYTYHHVPLTLFHGYSAYIHYNLFWKFRIKKTVYVKKEYKESEARLLRWSFDNVKYLENVGREGGTYLHHIVHNWEDLADKTLFLQAHSQWHEMTHGRLRYIDSSTGFLSLGPYVLSQCGESWPGSYPQMKSIWSLFHGEPCPENEHQLSTWSGQFVVSRQRIRHNHYKNYVEMLHLMTAPSDHPIYDESPDDWTPPRDPINPYIGHSLERSWPIIFNCNQPTFATDTTHCGGEVLPGSPDCQCFDSENLD
ncbi:hypothetical protein E3Q17_02948 [Wallemia mellicola]|uniref:Uncharacterized protein n=1 Tax=Wallemia mellicola TaxID=1708541 RepID=A0A4V4ML87_9BASI|nr:hypothetical protein E3Q17_02948 [Wallemia mellicola]TIC10193.1 hypothetical protein E3Q14_02935 [Wallemia mellicola]